MYLVAHKYTNKKNDGTETCSLMSETFHVSIDEALADYTTRLLRGTSDLIIAKILQVKTVLVDYDSAGVNEKTLS